MELWIRSQDRTELFHPTSIWMVKDENSVYCQYGLNKTCIAIYKSEERALEVLDEIQDVLMPKMIYHANNVEFIPDYQATTGGKFVSNNDDSKMEYMNMPIVYYMPKE